MVNSYAFRKVLFLITSSVLFLVYHIHQEIFYVNNTQLPVVVAEYANLKVHFVSFANVNYTKALTRIREQALKIPLFTTVTTYNESHEFFKTHKYSSQTKGFGYYSWKPVMVLDRMNQVEDDEIIAYFDSGCVLYSNKEALVELQKAINLVNKYELLAYHLPVQTNAQWTKGDTLLELNCTDVKCKHSKQTGATLFLIKNTKTMRNFIKLWKYYSFKNGGHFIDDTPSTKYKNSYNFREHRWDQSIFSILIYKTLNKSQAYISKDIPWNCFIKYTNACWVASARKNN